MTAGELARFLAKVEDAPCPVEGLGPCLLWTGAIQSAGYALLKPDGPRRTAPVLAHRLAYEHWVGPIPDGLQIDHLCRVRACVRPEHLEPVTRHENQRRGARGLHDGRERCVSGRHLLEGNVYEWRGRRYCRPCQTEAAAARRAAARIAA